MMNRAPRIVLIGEKEDPHISLVADVLPEALVISPYQPFDPKLSKTSHLVATEEYFLVDGVPIDISKVRWVYVRATPAPRREDWVKNVGARYADYALEAFTKHTQLLYDIFDGAQWLYRPHYDSWAN
jgi:hypothetical protein